MKKIKRDVSLMKTNLGEVSEKVNKTMCDALDSMMDEYRDSFTEKMKEFEEEKSKIQPDL